MGDAGSSLRDRAETTRAHLARPVAVRNHVGTMTDAYPAELASFVRSRLAARGIEVDAGPLQALLSAIYQASLLREEGRSLSFRVLYHPADALPADVGPPEAVLPARFDRGRRLDAQELRRVAPAARRARTMIGVDGTRAESLQIWGLVHTGSASHALTGTSIGALALPPALVIEATSPGCLVVDWSHETIARLVGGVVSAPSSDVFSSMWLSSACSEPDDETRASSADAVWLGLFRQLDRQFVARVIGSIRAARHGGTIVLLPTALAETVAQARRPIALKYSFLDQAARRRYRELQNRLLHAARQRPIGEALTWDRYRTSHDPELVAVDRALLELARGVADLAAVDGVVLMSKRFEVMGFGGEIVGELPEVPEVARALDVEGEHTERESTEAVGTRHRSVYRLAARTPEMLAFVVSQDGGVRLVASRSGDVTYWDQLGPSPMER